MFLTGLRSSATPVAIEFGDLPEERSGEEKVQEAKAPVDKEELKRMKKEAQPRDGPKSSL